MLIERWAYSEPCRRSKIEPFRKIVIALNYFRKTLHFKSLRGFYICVGNMSQHWIFQDCKCPRVTQCLPIFVNMTVFWICAKLQLWKGPEYSTIPCHIFFYFHRDSLHARLNSHYDAWSYKKKKHKKIRANRKSV